MHTVQISLNIPDAPCDAIGAAQKNFVKLGVRVGMFLEAAGSANPTLIQEAVQMMLDAVAPETSEEDP